MNNQPLQTILGDEVRNKQSYTIYGYYNRDIRTSAIVEEKGETNPTEASFNRAFKEWDAFTGLMGNALVSLGSCNKYIS